MGIVLKSERELAKMREAGLIVRAVLDAVGVVSAPARALVAATQECLERAIRACVPGARLGDIGAVIQGHAEELGYSVVREFVGHGIGRAMHEPPSVPNHGREGSGLRLRPGMVLAIEPML